MISLPNKYDCVKIYNNTYCDKKQFQNLEPMKVTLPLKVCPQAIKKN